MLDEPHRNCPQKVTRAGISDRLRLMLHAAVIGFPSTGKSTLFQLMTSVDAPARQRRREHRHLEGARRPARSPDGDVQPEEARARDGGVHRHRRASAQRRQRARRCRRLQERRRARARRARVPRRGGAASGRLRRSGTRRAGDGGRVDPRGSRHCRAPPRTPRQGSEEGQVAGARDASANWWSGARTSLEGGAAAARAAVEQRRSQAAARLSVPLGQAAPARHQRRRNRHRRHWHQRRRDRRPHRADGVSRPRRHQSRGAVRQDRARDLAARSLRTPPRSLPISDCTNPDSIA